MNKKKKYITWLFTSTLIVVGVVYFSTQFEEVDLKLYGEPIILTAVEISESDSLTGLWTGVHGYYHDCTGCETRNRIWLSVGNNYNVVMIEAIDVFTKLYHIPIIDKIYGNPKEWIVKATNFKGRGECLVEMATVPIDSIRTNYLIDNYQKYNCEFNSNDVPVNVYKMERRGKNLILTP